MELEDLKCRFQKKIFYLSESKNDVSSSLKSSTFFGK